MEYNGCLLCHSKEYKILYNDVSDYLLKNNQKGYTYVKCTECGLVFMNPHPSLQEIINYYPDEYEPYRVSHSRIANLLSLHSSWKRYRFIKPYKNSGKLLDIGCSTGTFLNYLKHKGGWDVYGVEMNENAAKIGLEKGINIKIGHFEQVEFDPQSFDVVTLWDVLEHMYDPITVLNKIHQLLKPGGILVIRVPNMDSIDAKIFKKYWAGLDAPRHLYVFTKFTLHKLLFQSNFSVLSTSTNIGAYTTFILSIRFLLTAKQTPDYLSSTLMRILYSPLARMLFVLPFSLTSKACIGPLMVTIARKEVKNDRNSP